MEIFRARLRSSSLFVAALALMLGTIAAGAEDPPPGIPGRLVEYTFVFGPDRPFESYSVVFRLHNDVAASVPLHVAVMGRVVINGIEVSGGLGSQLSGFRDEYQRERVQAGPGLFFLRMGTGHPAVLRVPKGSLRESIDDPAPSVQAVRPFGWTKGLYEYRLRRTATQVRGDKEYTWVGAFIFSHKSGREQELGSVRFEGAALTLSGTTTAFVDSGALDPAGKGVPRLRMTFWDWTINGTPVRPNKVTASYPAGAAPVVATHLDQLRVVSDIGVSVDRGTSRNRTKGPEGLVQVVYERPNTVPGL